MYLNTFCICIFPRHERIVLTVWRGITIIVACFQNNNTMSCHTSKRLLYLHFLKTHRFGGTRAARSTKSGFHNSVLMWVGERSERGDFCFNFPWFPWLSSNCHHFWVGSPRQKNTCTSEWLAQINFTARGTHAVETVEGSDEMSGNERN